MQEQNYEAQVEKLIQRQDQNNVPLLMMFLRYEQLRHEESERKQRLLSLEVNGAALDRQILLNAKKYEEKRKGFLRELGYEFVDLSEQEQTVHEKHLQQFEAMLRKERERDKLLADQRLALEVERQNLLNRETDKQLNRLRANMDEWIAERDQGDAIAAGNTLVFNTPAA